MNGHHYKTGHGLIEVSRWWPLPGFPIYPLYDEDWHTYSHSRGTEIEEWGEEGEAKRFIVANERFVGTVYWHWTDEEIAPRGPRFYWAKRENWPAGNIFVIYVNRDNIVYRVAGADDYPCYHITLDEMIEAGLILGPEIPAWEESLSSRLFRDGGFSHGKTEGKAMLL